MNNKNKKADIFRDTPIRYLGYANEVGEAFHQILPIFYLPSYVISFAYVFTDTFSKGRLQYIRDKKIMTRLTVLKTLDCLL